MIELAADVEPLDIEDAPALMTITEVRRVLRCGYRQAYELVSEEDGLGCKVRGSWRVPREALREHLREQLPEKLQGTMQPAREGTDGNRDN